MNINFIKKRIIELQKYFNYVLNDNIIKNSKGVINFLNDVKKNKM